MAAKKHAVTGDQYIGIDKKIADIKRQLRQDGGSSVDPNHLNWALQQLGEGRSLILADELDQLSAIPIIVAVPDLAAVDLTASAKQDLDLTDLDEYYTQWDYYRDTDGNSIRGRGLQFEVLIYKPELTHVETISSAKARFFLEARGFIGHVGAFTQWRRVCGLGGYYTTIPRDSACWSTTDKNLYVPYSSFDGGSRRLYRRWVGLDWDNRWSFVGFREIS